MMNGPGRFGGEHLGEEALDRYRSRVAPPAELLEADAHIAACDTCFDAVRAEHDTIALPNAGDPHLTYEELEAFVDGRADALDRELVTAHVAFCTPCSSELADITATRNALAPGTPRTPQQVRRRLTR